MQPTTVMASARVWRRSNGGYADEPSAARGTIGGSMGRRENKPRARVTDHASPPSKAAAAADNAHLAARLNEFAALLELAGASYYSARAYSRAAELVRSAPVPVAQLVREGRVRALKGIGPAIEGRLRELAETGEIAEMVELRRSRPLELAALGRLLGLGAKRATEISSALGITTVAEFRVAADEGRLREVPGIGPKREAKILAALSNERPVTPRLLLPQARMITESVASALGGLVAGDARRWLDTPARLAVVVASEDPAEVREQFAQLP